MTRFLLAGSFIAAIVVGGLARAGATASGPCAPLASLTCYATPQTGYGPRYPVGPQSSVACPGGAISITAPTSIQTTVNAHAAGSTYCLTGAFTGQSVIPQAGDTYVCAYGASLNGQGSTQYAFRGTTNSNVTISNCLIANYAPGSQDGIISMSGGTGWTLSNDEISGSNASGIRVLGGSTVSRSYIHNNAEEGYSCSGTGVTLTDDEIASNNPNDAYSPNFEAGGGKASNTTNLVVEYVWSHDNHGPGLWTDINNVNSTYEYNDVENNWAAGIMHEISWNAVIDNNYAANNANSKYCSYPSAHYRTLWCSEIFISNSGGQTSTVIDISGNVLVPNTMNAAIGLVNRSRGSGTYGTWQCQNVQTHANTVNLSAGGVVGGADYDGTDPGMFTSQGNTWDYDVYTGASSTAFQWSGTSGTFASFEAYGLEAHGSSH